MRRVCARITCDPERPGRAGELFIIIALGVGLSTVRSRGGERRPHPFQTAEPARLKILVVGPHQSGKSCLIKNYCEGRFVKRYLPTIGIDYGVRQVDIQGTPVRVNFFDASGGQEFKSIRSEFYRESHALIYVVDISDTNSLLECQQFVAEAQQWEIKLQYLVATKTDLGQKLSDGELTDFGKKIGAKLFKANAMTGDGVEYLFTQIFKDAFLFHMK